MEAEVTKSSAFQEKNWGKPLGGTDLFIEMLGSEVNDVAYIMNINLLNSLKIKTID